MARRKIFTNRQLKLLGLALLAVIIWLIDQVAPQDAPAVTTPTEQAIQVVRVVDGDTIEIETGQRVRLIGVDTPELNNGNNPDCYAQEAYEFTREELEGQTVRLEKDVSDTDRYGRLLRYVYLEGQLFNKTLVREGYANARSYPPDVSQQESLRIAEQDARNEEIGLWNTKVCPQS